MKKPVDHYARIDDFWREKFTALDHEELARRFRLKVDEDFLYIVFYSRTYKVCRKTGIITDVENPETPTTFDIRMSILHLFYYSKPDAVVSGRFVPFREIKGASPYAPAFQRSVAEGLAAPFNGWLEQLKKACLALGGQLIPQSDAGFLFRAFDCMPVMLLFWDGDEEFGAQANLLFDAEITDFIHEETVCCIAGHLMSLLRVHGGVSHC